ncbi:MAG: MBL fold metallo-hydrolase [Verrucomicrobia bacterium]|nr:MBL fold metallo-hydrolase [Verrucomicrobiota bacterium]
MFTSLIRRSCWVALGLMPLGGSAAPEFTGVEPQVNGDVVLRWTGTPGTTHQLQASSNLVDWTTLTTTRAAAVNQETDAGAAYLDGRAYRVLDQGETNLLTGDHLATDAGDVVLHPINHASLVLQWHDRMVYNDPVGSAALYSSLPKADLILVSHSHGDHFNASTLSTVLAPEGFIVAPAAVYSSLSATLRARTIPLANGQSTNLFNLSVEAIPAYNANHPKGVGNGYVLTIGGRRIYFSGDTGDIPEMRSLPEIDVAYVCMNVPFTMTVAQASSAVRAFRPAVVYPYHFRNQDNTRANTNLFKTQIGTDLGVEVRLRTWY